VARTAPAREKGAFERELEISMEGELDADELWEEFAEDG
jgi:hypothetical protein